MKWGLLPRVVRIAALALAFLASPAHAFTFAEGNEGVRVAQTAPVATGEVWAFARTESWQKTKNTVWGHCEAVLASYGGFTEDDVRACQIDVGTANNMTLTALSQLEVGEEIILPLTQTQAAAYRQEATANETGSETVLTRVETALNELKAREIEQTTSITSLRDAVAAQQKQMAVLSEEVSTLQDEVKNLPAAPAVSQPSSTSTIEPAVATSEVPLAVWIMAGVSAVLLLFLIVAIVTIRTEQLKRRALKFENTDLNEKLRKATVLDFNRQKYVFDGQEYWIELIYVTKEGKVYRTPFAAEVKEHNLKSHFAQATKKGPQFKAAAE
jgi:uncharacterized coiled-coil protein SlyX